MVRNDSLEGALGPNGRRGESPRNLCSVRSPWDQRCVQAALGNVWETTASRRWPSGCPKAQDSRFVTGCAWGQAEVRKHAGESGAPFDRHTVEPKKTRVCSVRIPTAAREPRAVGTRRDKKPGLRLNGSHSPHAQQNGRRGLGLPGGPGV